MRTAIEDTFRKVIGESDSVAPNDVVLANLKSERAQLVKLFIPLLVDVALTKLLNEVCQKRIRVTVNSDEGDLFGRFGNIPKRVTIERGLKKDTANLALDEAKRWLEKHSKRIVEDDNEDFRRIVAECEIFAQRGDETISDLLFRMRQNRDSDASN